MMHTRPGWRTVCVAFGLTAAGAALTAQDDAATAATHHQRGVDFHLQRRIDEASREYARTLALDPPRAPGPDERAVIIRFAPRVYVTPDEVFSLKDAAAVLHPAERLIAYHFFWEDDIDFPEDNDPCDHEVVWVRFSPDRRSIEKFWTYFHGRILDAGVEALRDAASHGMRPRVNVQWGKHGSMPFGWESMPIVGDQGDLERAYYATGKPIPLADYNRGTWEKLRVEGRRLKEHPLGKRLGWPDQFTGDWERFIDFSRRVDLESAIGGQMVVSRWNSAVINQHFLPYNFRPKTEWPLGSTAGAARVPDSPTAIVKTASLETYRLPEKSVFDTAMPRYPNVWFYVDRALADSYRAAVRLVVDQIRSPMRLREDHGPFSNPEGCDFEVRLEHLQPWADTAHRPLQHAHAFHMRYYHSALARQNLEQVTLETVDGQRQFFRIAASAHYEVEHTNPNHADVETCPICGRTGEYADLVGNLVERVHDPLGLELLFNGTIRNEPVKFEDDLQDVVGLRSMRGRFAMQQQVFGTHRHDQNTLRIGIVVVAPAR